MLPGAEWPLAYTAEIKPRPSSLDSSRSPQGISPQPVPDTDTPSQISVLDAVEFPCPMPSTQAPLCGVCVRHLGQRRGPRSLLGSCLAGSTRAPGARGGRGRTSRGLCRVGGCRVPGAGRGGGRGAPTKPGSDRGAAAAFPFPSAPAGGGGGVGSPGSWHQAWRPARARSGFQEAGGEAFQPRLAVAAAPRRCPRAPRAPGPARRARAGRRRWRAARVLGLWVAASARPRRGRGAGRPRPGPISLRGAAGWRPASGRSWSRFRACCPRAAVPPRHARAPAARPGRKVGAQDRRGDQGTGRLGMVTLGALPR
jgi:hypothetical protein